MAAVTGCPVGNSRYTKRPADGSTSLSEVISDDTSPARPTSAACAKASGVSASDTACITSNAAR